MSKIYKKTLSFDTVSGAAFGGGGGGGGRGSSSYYTKKKIEDERKARVLQGSKDRS